ncbi:MAG: transcription antitermination factor NusB [Pseudomonadota bacterium]
MSQESNQIAIHKRQVSRRLALQALYQWQFTQASAVELIAQYEADEYWPKSDHDYVSQLVSECIKQVDTLDEQINACSDYTVDKIDPIELASLRIAVYELLNTHQVPEKVITSEAIRLCKKFGSDEGYKLVNAILDKLMKKIDRSEMLQQT